MRDWLDSAAAQRSGTFPQRTSMSACKVIPAGSSLFVVCCCWFVCLFVVIRLVFHVITASPPSQLPGQRNNSEFAQFASLATLLLFFFPLLFIFIFSCFVGPVGIRSTFLQDTRRQSKIDEDHRILCDQVASCGPEPEFSRCWSFLGWP
jgi:uncharacterized membrane protein YjgN (DUF898 family)